MSAVNIQRRLLLLGIITECDRLPCYDTNLTLIHDGCHGMEVCLVRKFLELAKYTFYTCMVNSRRCESGGHIEN
jgi:hypothetical protein